MIGLSARTMALAKKEIYSFCNAPFFYGITVFFLLFCSIWFFYLQRFFTMNIATLRPYFAAFPIVFILIIPVITMRSWAEERKLGSIELLLTMPFSEWELVLGKYISALAMLLTMLVLSIPLPLSLLPLGDFDGGIIFAEYLGAFLLGSSAAALGLLLSSLAKNQAGSFLGSVAVLIVVMLINQLTLTFDLPQWLSDGVNFISLSFHFESFARGLIDTRDMVFFILSGFLFLYLNTRVLLFRKWR
jgi:ABC-2 type transport system permease protein